VENMAQRKVSCEVYTDRGLVGPKGEDGVPNSLSIGTVEGGETASATITGEAPNQTLSLVLPKGDKGDNGQDGKDGENGQDGVDGVGISSISKTSTSGLVDTYTITMTDGNTTTFDVTNGKDGIDGQDGNDGTDGQDGFSPSATVSKSGSVTTLTVTDKDGTTTATINDGEVSQAELNSALALKQDTLVSGTNIKTVNGNSLLGSGNVDINGLPSQTGQSGKYLTTDGTNASWANVNSLPSQTGQNGKFLTTDGTDASWEEVNVPSDVWTQNNLVAGENVTITKQPNPYVINEDTLAIFHLDGNFNNGIDNSNFSIVDEAVAAGYESSFLTGSDKKFGTAASDRVYDNGTWYYRNLSINAYKQFPNGFTIDFWAKRPVSSDIMSSGIIPGGYGLYVNGFGYVGFGAGSYSEPLYATSWNVNADPTNWHHIAISISPTKRRFFLDGVLVVSADFSGSLELAANARSQFGQVIIDELRITNRALWQDTDDFSADLPNAPYDVADDVYEINANAASSLPLFTSIWADHILNNASYLRADTFSWQSGAVYVSAYQHLVADISGITAETETINGTTITFYRATDGHKIVLPDQETNVSAIYTATGVAWYYILDTTNQRFKLPRENPAREELINLMKAKGNGKSLGIIGKNGDTIIENSLAHIRSYWFAPGSLASADVGAAAVAGSIPEGTYAGINTDATKSGIVIDPTESDTTFAGKKYLYFYVGNTVQDQTTIDVGQITETLNGKADTNLSNVTGTSGFRKLVEVYSNGTSWYKVFDEYDPTTGTFIGKWCEQGNSTEFIPTTGQSVVFLKPFASDDFCAFVCKATSNYSGAATNPCCIRNNGGLGMAISVGGGANEYAQWYACGYIA
jgi:hypothetical protein